MQVGPGSDFGRLWSAYAVSTYGTWIAFGAFPLIAVQALDVPTVAVAILESAALAVAAVTATPLGPWVDRRAKRPVMVATDIVRFLAMASIPIAYLLGVLSYAQVLIVAVISGTAAIAFTAASGAYVRHLVPGDRLVAANGRFEATNWVATAAGPPLGGVLVSMCGPVVTVAIDAVSFLLSAVAVRRIRGSDIAARRGNDIAARRAPATRRRTLELREGWRVLLADPVLRRLFLNSMAVNGLIMATSPLLAVLLLGQFGMPAWQYGLAFGIPALGGLAGARLSALLVARYGRHRVMLASGWLRSIFPLGLAFAGPGTGGLVTVIVVEALLITSMGIFNPIAATEKLQRTPADHTARALTAWSVSSKLSQAGVIALGGVVATATTPLTAITICGVLLLATPLLLPKRRHLTPPMEDSGRWTCSPPSNLTTPDTSTSPTGTPCTGRPSAARPEYR
ncbi:MFS transporter [Rhodococcus phenolicus]|uniref:MFS transporter n=1 Tax=Rhodococcus phenolicus TaxID=263849 RepID=UPI0009EEBB29|nr:MFS transporter [Rhodococcus phenolicus]